VQHGYQIFQTSQAYGLAGLDVFYLALPAGTLSWGLLFGPTANKERSVLGFTHKPPPKKATVSNTRSLTEGCPQNVHKTANYAA
jgi:hypothetical protein